MAPIYDFQRKIGKSIIESYNDILRQETSTGQGGQSSQGGQGDPPLFAITNTIINSENQGSSNVMSSVKYKLTKALSSY